MTTILTDDNFASEVLVADTLAVVDFWATWCPPCVALAPVMDALARDHAGQIKVGKLNVDENPKVSVGYGVTNLPCVLFLYKGQVVDKLVGAASKSVYDKKVRAILESLAA